MNETIRMWVEVVFNVTYLIVVWSLVIAMLLRSSRLTTQDRRVGRLFMWSFALLGLGDTGHVGFRVAAYALGGIDRNITLVGIGSLATAITVTLFYVLMVAIWKTRFNRKYGYAGGLLIAAAVARLVLLAFPANNWGGVATPDWILYRNIPLMVQGLGVMLLMLRDGLKNGDRLMRNTALAIMVSYACYLPVILVNGNALVGMLMIPKTLAYLAIAVFAYRGMYGTNHRAHENVGRGI